MKALAGGPRIDDPPMEIKQQLKLSQQLVMTPQLQQAIRLLQLSRMELVDEVRREMDANPMLADEDVEPRQGNAGERQAVASGEEGRNAPDLDLTRRAEERKVREVDWEQFLENRAMQPPIPSGRSGFEELPPIEANLTRPRSLVEHLRWQLQMNEYSEEEQRFAEVVIGNLDENGYLDLSGVEREDGTPTPDTTIEDLAQEAGLEPEDAPEVLRLIQEMDPVGIAARDLRECLLVQAEVYGLSDLERQIVDRHLDNLEKHNFQAISREMKLPLDEVYEAAEQIQKLESRPARNFTDTDERSIGITPDVYVIKDGDEFVVLDNDKGMQRLYINDSLMKLASDPKAKEYIGEKLRSAQWLIRAIEQRRRTIIRVTECIVRRQRDFFEKGVAYLKPMILRDVAEDEEVKMHESTISRVTTNKYVQTPRGLFELKYFFNSSIQRVSEDDIASEAVKEAIKKIIKDEDKTNPLSDQAIVDLLKQKEGIKIARRTVAKYREMLGILASPKRKKHF